MLLGETIGVALGALRANKLRSFLTMLGVVIGVGAVIAVVALGRGAQQSVNARISALGTTLLTVMPGQVVRTGVAAEGDRAALTISDARAIQAANSPLIQTGNCCFQVFFARKNAPAESRSKSVAVPRKIDFTPKFESR